MTRSDSKTHSCIVQAFSKNALNVKQWRNHFVKAIQLLSEQQSALRSQEVTNEIQVRLLDSDNHGETSRAAETMVLTLAPLTLQACSVMSKSQPLSTMEQEVGIEYIIQPTELVTLHRGAPGLAVFDMDSTLIQQEVIDELARAVGLYAEVSAITEAAMRGEAPYTDFEASLKARVALLKGVPTTIWDQLKTSVITFTPGAQELVRSLKALGWKTAVLSGGFTPLAEWVKETLGLDYAYANHLASDEQQGILTGELVPGKPIIHAEKKRELLTQIASREGIPLERVIAVGDGSNDLLMMSVAGLGIAFNAKPKVQKAAPVRLNSGSLLDVMYILGYTKQEAEDLRTGTERR